MFNIISTFTGLADKAKLTIIAVLVVIILICAVVIGIRGSAIEDLQADVSRLTLERELAIADYRLARAELDRQSELIKAHSEAMQKSKSAADKEIAALRAESGKVKTEYITKLVQDPSCENQLRLIKKAQGAFYEK